MNLSRRALLAAPVAALAPAPIKKHPAWLMRGGKSDRYPNGRFDMVPGPNGGLVVPPEWRNIIANEWKTSQGFESQYVYRMRAFGTA